MSDVLRCPKCDSFDVECDGLVHHCAACGYDGRAIAMDKKLALETQLRVGSTDA